MGRKKTWREKLGNSKDLPRVEVITDKMSKRWGSGTIVIPAPKEVDDIMKKIPKGKLITINEIRQILARKHKATISCPLTTGIFARIAAEAAMEDAQEGKKMITPYWRTLKSDGELNQKYPGGIEGQNAPLESEGQNVIQKGKKFIPKLSDSVKGVLAEPHPERAGINPAPTSWVNIREVGVGFTPARQRQHHPESLNL